MGQTDLRETQRIHASKMKAYQLDLFSSSSSSSSFPSQKREREKEKEKEIKKQALLQMGEYGAGRCRAEGSFGNWAGISMNNMPYHPSTIDPSHPPYHLTMTIHTPFAYTPSTHKQPSGSMIRHPWTVEFLFQTNQSPRIDHPCQHFYSHAPSD